MGITRKKRLLYVERCAEKRVLFQQEIAALSSATIIYVDEAGVDNRLFRPYAKAARGQKIYADIIGKKRERFSMIGGLMGKNFIAPFTFQGGCNANVNSCLKNILLLDIPKGATIVMDNAAFHKSTKTKELIEQFGYQFLFLPPYSPDLNPIEHCWHTLKAKLRSLIP